MAARGHKRVTVGTSDIDVVAASYAAGGPRAGCCDAIRVHAAGSLYCLLEGMADDATPTQHQFYAAGDGLGLRIRTIKSTNDGSTAMDVDLYWDEP